MFGLPAGYVGRRLFVCLLEDGLIIRLPPDVVRREIKGRGAPFTRRGKGRTLGSWVMYRPRTVVEARRLVPVLEVAARHIAERQMPPPKFQEPNSQIMVGSRGVGRWELRRKRR